MVNIVTCGQSGQGVILVTKILMTAFQAEGQDVAGTEYPAITHRFAITFSHIRAGAGVLSPRIPPGGADLVVGLEPFECLKVALLYGNPDTLIVTNREFIRTDGTLNPLLRDPIATETADDVVAALRGRGFRHVVSLNAADIALRTLRHRAGTNIVMLGAAFASGRIPIAAATLEAAVADVVPPGTGDRNLEALRAGIAAFAAAAVSASEAGARS